VRWHQVWSRLPGGAHATKRLPDERVAERQQKLHHILTPPVMRAPNKANQHVVNGINLMIAYKKHGCRPSDQKPRATICNAGSKKLFQRQRRQWGERNAGVR
jgi:hypothetical protein